MRRVNLAGVNRVKSRNGSNLGALGTGALGALSSGALASFRAGRHWLLEPAARRPIFPNENAGAGRPAHSPHLAAEKPAAAPPIFPTGNARTAARPPDLAARPLDQAAGRRAA